MTPDAAVNAFIARWSNVGAAERANYALFLAELCDVLDVPRPDPARDDTAHNAYVFEHAVPLHQRDGKTTTGRIDLYKRACFVLEAKQYATATAESSISLLPSPIKPRSGLIRGSEAWDDAMIKARGQAENYARNLPATEPTPPFLLVVDVGHVFELYADFSQQGKAYLPFPDPRSHRIRHVEPAIFGTLLERAHARRTPQTRRQRHSARRREQSLSGAQKFNAKVSTTLIRDGIE